MSTSNVLFRGDFANALLAIPTADKFGPEAGTIAAVQLGGLGSPVCRVVTGKGRDIYSSLSAQQRKFDELLKADQSGNAAELFIGETVVFKPMTNYHEVMSELRKKENIEFRNWSGVSYQFAKATLNEIVEVVDNKLSQMVVLDPGADTYQRAEVMTDKLSKKEAAAAFSANQRKRTINRTPGTKTRYRCYRMNKPRPVVEPLDLTTQVLIRLMMKEFIDLTSGTFMQPVNDEWHETWLYMWTAFDAAAGTSLHREHERLKNSGQRGSVLELAAKKTYKGRPMLDHVYAFVWKYFNTDQVFELEEMADQLTPPAAVASQPHPAVKKVFDGQFGIANASTDVVETTKAAEPEPVEQS